MEVFKIKLDKIGILKKKILWLNWVRWRQGSGGSIPWLHFPEWLPKYPPSLHGIPVYNTPLHIIVLLWPTCYAVSFTHDRVSWVRTVHESWAGKCVQNAGTCRVLRADVILAICPLGKGRRRKRWKWGEQKVWWMENECRASLLVANRELGEIGFEASERRGLMTVPRLCDVGNVGT